MSNVIFLHNSIGALSYDDSLSIIFVYFVFEDKWECPLINLYPTFSVEPNQIVLYDLCSVFLALYQNAIEFVASDGHISLNQSLTHEPLMGADGYPIFLIFVNFVEVDDWKTAKYFNPTPILTNIVPAHICLAAESQLNSHRVVTYLVLI